MRTQSTRASGCADRRQSDWPCDRRTRPGELSIGRLANQLGAATDERRFAGHKAKVLGAERVGPRVPVGYINPTTCPSRSEKRAIVVSGATSVSGMITRPPSSSTLRRVADGSSVWT